MFDKLYTAEWFKIVNPVGIIDKLLTCFRLLLSPIVRITDKIYTFNNRVVSSGYDVLELKTEDILYVENKDIAGMPDKCLFKYRVTNIDKNYEMLGCGYTDKIAVRNMHYIIKDGVYWFNEHPSVYCTSFLQNKDVIYKTVGFANDYTHIQQALKPQTDSVLTPESANSYNTITVNGLMGALNTLYLYQQGIFSTDGLHGNFQYIWEEQGRIFGITDTGNLISAPYTDKVSIKYADKVKIDTTPDYFTVELNNIHYPVSYLANDLQSYPGLLSKFPTLKTTDNMFLGVNLYDILKNDGCNFTEIAYINTYTIDNNFISNSMCKGDKFLYLGSISVPVESVHTSDISDASRVFSDTLFSNISVEIKYVF